MSKEYFNKEKQEYENVDIPEDLDFLVRKTLKEGKRRKKHNTISKWSTAVASVTITFILLVNLFPKVAYAASLIPGLDKLVKLVTWDKGFDNAISEGLTQEINFKETQNGITLRVDGLAGDWKKLWVNFSIDDGKGNEEKINGMPKYSVEVEAILPSDYEDGYSYENGNLDQNGQSYIALSFSRFVEDFTLKFKIYENGGEATSIADERPKPNYIAEFDIPITLDPNIFNSLLNDVAIDNNMINTSVGDIVISSLESSKTRILMTFNLESSIYDFMSFDNPKLVDDKGNIYTVAGSYTSKDSMGNECIEFAGEIKEGIKSFRFECDGVYYARKDNRDIVINLKEKLVEPNDYGFRFDIEENSDSINNYVIIKSNEIKGASFKEVNNKNGELILQNEGVGYYGSDKEGYTTKVYFRIFDKNAEKVTVNLYWVLKDKTEPVSARIIK